MKPEVDFGAALKLEKQQETSLPELPKHHPNRPKGISKDWLIACVRGGLSDAEIAELAGCSKTNITIRRRKWLGKIADDEAFEKVGAIFLRIKRKQALDAITEKKCKDEQDVEKLTKAHKNLLHDERLITGQSTSNIAYADLVQLKKQKEEELKKLEEEYQRVQHG